MDPTRKAGSACPPAERQRKHQTRAEDGAQLAAGSRTGLAVAGRGRRKKGARTGDVDFHVLPLPLAHPRNATSTSLSAAEVRRRLQAIRAAVASVLGLGTEREIESIYMRVSCQQHTGDELIVYDSFQAFQEDVQFLFHTTPVENKFLLMEISQIERMKGRALFDVWYLYIVKEHDSEIGKRLREMNVIRKADGASVAAIDPEEFTGTAAKRERDADANGKPSDESGRKGRVEDPNQNQIPSEMPRKKSKLEKHTAFRRKGLTYDQRIAELKLVGLATEGMKVVINEGHEEDEEDILVPFELSDKLKPHQIQGINFLWDILCGKERNKHGAILAHAMGLGKSLQVITVIATLMTELTLFADIERKKEMIPEHLFPGHVVILCPATLINNWRDEFDRWIPPGTALRSVIGNVVTINDSAQEDRYPQLSRWFRSNGILVLSYNMYRLYVGDALRSHDTLDMQMQEWLIGKVSLVVADEGHTLKNDATILFGMLRRVQTPSRICLTGYPLQNRLEEYWCMVEWVAPGLLPGLDDFKHTFVKPVTRGLFINSTSEERMESATKLRVLMNLISSVVQRRDSKILRDSLPPLHDFVLSCRLTELQRKLYKGVIAEIYQTTTGTLGMSSFLDRGRMLQLLCNHPRILKAECQARSRKRAAEANAICNSKAEQKPIGMPEEVIDDEEEEGHIIANGDHEVLESLQKVFASVGDVEALYHSHKANVMMTILDISELRCEKVLIFARTLPTLEYIQRITVAKGYDVFRIDSTSPVNGRQKMITDFNKKEGFAVFIISPQTAGVGVNLVSANRVIIFDIGWNPSIDEQALARAYRFGQEQHVYVYRLGTRETWEEVLFKNNIHKVGLAMRAVDNVAAERRFERDDLKNYFAIPSSDFETRLPNWARVEDAVLRAVLFRHRAGLVNVVNHEIAVATEEDEGVDHTRVTDLLKGEHTRLKQAGKATWCALFRTPTIEGNPLEQVALPVAPLAVPPEGPTDQGPQSTLEQEFLDKNEPLYAHSDNGEARSLADPHEDEPLYRSARYGGAGSTANLREDKPLYELLGDGGPSTLAAFPPSGARSIQGKKASLLADPHEDEPLYRSAGCGGAGLMANIPEDKPLYEHLGDGRVSTLAASPPSEARSVQGKKGDFSAERSCLPKKPPKQAAVRVGPAPFGWPGVRAARFGSQAPARRRDPKPQLQAGTDTISTSSPAPELGVTSLEHQTWPVALPTVGTQGPTCRGPQPKLEKEFLNEDQPLVRYADDARSSSSVNLPENKPPGADWGSSTFADALPPATKRDFSTDRSCLPRKPPEQAAVRAGPAPFGWPGVQALRFGSQAPARRRDPKVQLQPGLSLPTAPRGEEGSACLPEKTTFKPQTLPTKRH